MDLVLVPFAHGQENELVRMWRESFEGGVGIVDPHPVEEQRAYLEEKLLPTHDVRVALLNGLMVGFVATTRESVSQLHVRRSHQRAGIGTILLDWAKAQSTGSLWLFTFARNAAARAFYEKNGFVIVARGFEPHWQLEDIKYEWRPE
ncbi:MAG TPA: GNAT family N-acetyltransferase [Usitatibacter sp.]|nr:GNAT family N-acetyltransferase [Usitatibacter sp.]